MDEQNKHENDEVERCLDCGCTPEEGACFHCKMD